MTFFSGITNFSLEEPSQSKPIILRQHYVSFGHMLFANFLTVWYLDYLNWFVYLPMFRDLQNLKDVSYVGHGYVKYKKTCGVETNMTIS